MFKKNVSIFRLSIDLRKQLLVQIQSFELSKNEYLLMELKKLLLSNNKDQISTSYLKININQIKKLADLLNRLEGYDHLNDNFKKLFKSDLDKKKEEIISDLINLSSEFEFEFDLSSNNDKLIEDLFSSVFKYLSIGDLLNCRLVNKQFKYFSDNTNCINKLVIGESVSIYSDYYWYYNNKLIEDQDIISLECFQSINSLSIFNLDKNLKYLKIYDQEFKLEELSNLINLESLEFGCKFNNHHQQIINLNNLKILASNNLLIQLNAPKLERIHFYDINQIQLNSNPDSIKHLITFKYHNKLKIFKNLEIMELRNIDKLEDEIVLNDFKNLKQLKINNLKLNYSSKEMKKNLIKILDDTIRREIDFYLDGIKIKNIDQLNRLEIDGFWKFSLNNYDLLDLNLPFIRYLDYDDCLNGYLNNVKNVLPNSFFDKFFNLNLIIISDLKNADNSSWFISNLKCLKNLIIGSSSLGQDFYNNLPNKIQCLIIRNDHYIDNYDFILKLSKLIAFVTYNDKDLFDLAFTSFLNLKYLKNFRFFFGKKFIEIEKKEYGFCLKLDKEILDKEILDYDQLIEKCNSIRSK